jgi:cell division protein FtsL
VRVQRGGFLLWLVSALERLASHRLLDRLIRGRAWLVLITFALIGIVTLQLALLKLNGAVGRALHSQSLLQRENAALSIENSELSAADRVQAGAAQLGLAFASSASLRFLAPTDRGDFAHGAAALASPLHAPAGGAEQGASRAGGSSGEGGAEQGEGGTREGRSGEGRSGEAGASEGGSAEGRSSEGSQAAAGAETGSSQPSSSTGSEAQAPARGAEGSSGGESSSGGGQAGSGG